MFKKYKNQLWVQSAVGDVLLNKQAMSGVLKGTLSIHIVPSANKFDARNVADGSAELVQKLGKDNRVTQ